MSTSGNQQSQATNVQLYGGSNGNPTSVTSGGNLGTQLDFDLVTNIGKLILRTAQATRLQDIPCVMVIVYNPATNGNVWYAGYNDQAPEVGVGIPILPGEVAQIECTDANLLSFIPEVDGNPIYVIVLANNSNAQVTPNNPSPLDITPPTLSAFQPNVNPATNFPIFGTPIIVKASEALDPNTINNQTVTATPTMTATIALSTTDPTQIIVTPTASLSYNTQYTVTYGTGIADLAGNHLATSLIFKITTIVASSPADTTPPTVFATYPYSGSQNVNPSTTPSISFSEPMMASSFNSRNVVAYITNNNQQIPNLSFYQSQDLQTLYIGNMPMTTSTNYQITIYGGNGIGPTDLSGNYLQSTYYIPFTTAAPSSINIYTVTGNSYDSIQGSGWLFTGILLNSNRSLLVGEIPIGYTFIMHKVGSPTGTVYFNWYRMGYDGEYNLYRNLGSISASSLQSYDTTITVPDSGNTHTLQNNDIVVVQFTGGNSNNYVAVKISTYDAFDGYNTCVGKIDNFNGDLRLFSNYDLAGTISVA